MKYKSRILLVFLTSLAMSQTGCGTEDKTTAQPTGSSVMTNDSVRSVPVAATVIKRSKMKRTIPLTGVLQPLHSVDIVAEVSGKTRKIIKVLGDYVTTRDTLAIIDDRVALSQYKQARAQVLSAENNLNIAQINLESDKELYAHKDISRLNYENSLFALKSAKANHLAALARLSLQEKNYFDTRITSPINGHITRKHIELGTMVTPNISVYRVADLSSLKIEVGVRQSDIYSIQKGEEAQVTVSALNRSYPGRVRYISRQADEKTGAFLVEIHVRNTKDLAMHAGMTAKVELFIRDHLFSLTVPADVLISKDEATYIYKAYNGRAELTAVSVSKQIGTTAFISNGLAAGDTVVIGGMENLGLNTKISITAIH